VTLSILVQDNQTGVFGGAAMTGSLCVGGWVLRGNAVGGMSASQGTSPSTLWGEDVLAAMCAGRSAVEAIEDVVSHDHGRAQRQVAAIDAGGATASFTGAESVMIADSVKGDGFVVAGNMLSATSVLDAAAMHVRESNADVASRLLGALKAARDAGGDRRGLSSAALLVLSPNMAPLDLRVDWSDQPVSDLEKLLIKTRTAPYSDWIMQVPTLSDPFRHE
jgi:uncharacterized Ntn-hydrolase superfamily protein